MGLISHALAMGVGYVLGRPDTRQKLIELAHHPKAQQLREQGQNLATDGLHTAQHRLGLTADTKPTPAGEATLSAPSPARQSPAPAAAVDIDAGTWPLSKDAGS